VCVVDEEVGVGVEIELAAIATDLTDRGNLTIKRDNLVEQEAAPGTRFLLVV
jgi:hypothetical protein